MDTKKSCKGCTDRHVGCHQNCEHYWARKQIKDAAAAAEREAKRKEHELDSVEVECKLRAKKRRAKYGAKG